MGAEPTCGTEPTDAFAAATQAARVMVTARLHDDARLAGEVARSFGAADPVAALRLALVLCDLTATVHRWWAHAVFPKWGPKDFAEAWQHLLDLEAQTGPPGAQIVHTEPERPC